MPLAEAEAQHLAEVELLLQPPLALTLAVAVAVDLCALEALWLEYPQPLAQPQPLAPPLPLASLVPLPPCHRGHQAMEKAMEKRKHPFCSSSGRQ